MAFQQGGDRKGGKCGNQGIALHLHIAPVDDGADDAGVGTGAANSFALQGFDQGGFCESGRGLGFVAHRIHPEAAGGIPHDQSRQDHLLVFNRRVGVVGALDVGSEVAGEVDALAAGPKSGVFDFNAEGEQGLAGVGHLGGDGALPDQVVQLELAA
jgi:hypothetical protein